MITKLKRRILTDGKAEDEPIVEIEIDGKKFKPTVAQLKVLGDYAADAEKLAVTFQGVTLVAKKDDMTVAVIDGAAPAEWWKFDGEDPTPPEQALYRGGHWRKPEWDGRTLTLYVGSPHPQSGEIVGGCQSCHQEFTKVLTLKAVVKGLDMNRPIVYACPHCGATYAFKGGLHYSEEEGGANMIAFAHDGAIPEGHWEQEEEL